MRHGPIGIERTALLICDLQNDFLHPDGAYGRAGQAAPEIAAVPARVRPLAEELDPLLTERAVVLRRLHEIEAAAGRTREVRWGARTLDLDLVQHGHPDDHASLALLDGDLVLPHPPALTHPPILTRPPRPRPAAASGLTPPAPAASRRVNRGVPPREPPCIR